LEGTEKGNQKTGREKQDKMSSVRGTWMQQQEREVKLQKRRKVASRFFNPVCTYIGNSKTLGT